MILSIYSHLKAISGSTFVARRAGIQQASNATNVRLPAISKILLFAQRSLQSAAITAARNQFCAVLQHDDVFPAKERLKFFDVFKIDDG